MKLSDIKTFEDIKKYCKYNIDSIKGGKRNNSNSLNYSPIISNQFPFVIKSYGTPIAFVNTNGTIYSIFKSEIHYKSTTTKKIVNQLNKNGYGLMLTAMNFLCNIYEIDKGWNE